MHAQPGASHSEPAGEYDGCLKLRIEAPPFEAPKNAALRAFLAERLGVPRLAVRVQHGDTSRRKRILVTVDLAESDFAARLVHRYLSVRPEAPPPDCPATAPDASPYQGAAPYAVR